MKEGRKIQIIYEALHCYWLTVNQTTLPGYAKSVIKDFEKNKEMLNLINEIDEVLMEYQEKLEQVIDKTIKP